MLLINCNAGYNPALLAQIISTDKPIETRGRKTGYYKRLLHETIGIVKTGTKDIDNGCIVATAYVSDIIDLSNDHTKEQYSQMTKLDRNSKYWNNQTGLHLSDVTPVVMPIKVKVYPCCYYHMRLA